MAVTLFNADLTTPAQIKQLVTVLVADSPYAYIPGGDVRFIKVTVVGGGGGSGGAAATGTGTGSSAGSGAGGGAAIKWIKVSDLTWPQTVTVGAGGAGGAAGNNNGTIGGTTSFGAVCSATGGEPGFGSAASSNAVHRVAGGYTAGVGTGGDINLFGSSANSSCCFSGFPGRQAISGASPFAGGLRQFAGEGNHAASGSFPGGGSAGAHAVGAGTPSGSAKAGAAGGAGVCWIEEYY